jgi:hypothetical protein
MNRAFPKRVIVPLLPVLLSMGAAAAYVCSVEGERAYSVRNIVPLALVVVLSLIALTLGDGKWNGAGWRWPLAIAGFGIPSVGLSIYLHYAYAVNLDDMFSDTANAIEVFRYLPMYTAISGGFGFAIGWIIGSRV